MREVTITANDAGQRLDRFLKKYLCNAPLSLVYKAVRKDVKVNGKRAKEETLLAEGDVLQLYLSDTDLDALTQKKRRTAAKRQFAIACEDENVLVVCKPFGLLVHGDSTEKKDTLANQVVDYLIEKGDYVPRLEKSFVPSPVHRLDRNTTGTVVFGKNAEALRELAALFREDGAVSKFYYTIVHGRLTEAVRLKGKLLKDEERNVCRVLPESDERGKYIEKAWYVVRNTPGVTGFIGSSGKGAKPTPLQPYEVDNILKNMGISRLDVSKELEVGAKVKIIAGAFQGMYGTIESIDLPNQKLTLNVDLFGQETSIEAEVSQIELAN